MTTHLSLSEQYAAQLAATLGEEQKAPPKGKDVWLPPTRVQLAFGNVLAFDQSLAACGMVLLSHDRHILRVVDAVMFKTPSETSGHEDQFQRGVALARHVRSYLAAHDVHAPEWTAVHEAPPVGGGQIRTPESSLLAAQAIRIEMDYRGIPVAPMVTPQQHKWVTSGDRLIRKGPHRAALLRLTTMLGVEGCALITNEAHRDALSVALTHLVRTQADRAEG
jgi:Holliday junction resolvasome RuvABC endonuclease subunit